MKLSEAANEGKAVKSFIRQNMVVNFLGQVEVMECANSRQPENEQ